MEEMVARAGCSYHKVVHHKKAGPTQGHTNWITGGVDGAVYIWLSMCVWWWSKDKMTVIFILTGMSLQCFVHRWRAVQENIFSMFSTMRASVCEPRTSTKVHITPAGPQTFMSSSAHVAPQRPVRFHCIILFSVLASIVPMNLCLFARMCSIVAPSAHKPE